MSELYLKVNGKLISGWTGVRIEKSLFNFTSSFGISSANSFPGNAKKWKFSIGDLCTLQVNMFNIITGYIEDININYDDSNHNIQISGRDKTADLIDCSYVGANNQWENLTILSAIQRLTEQFEISVEADDSATEAVSTKTPANFKANEGETVFDSINKLSKYVGVLPISLGDGQLTLTKGGIKLSKDPLLLGVNIKSGSLTQSNKDRHNNYVVKGQNSGSDFLKQLGIDVSSPYGSALDASVERWRPLTILLEEKGNTSTCEERAIWERNIRAAKSRALQYTVQEWIQSNGKVWELNQKVRVSDDYMGIDGTFLIAGLTFTKDEDNGTLTTMDLIHPDALSVLTEDIADDDNGFNRIFGNLFK